MVSKVWLEHFGGCWLLFHALLQGMCLYFSEKCLMPFFTSAHSHLLTTGLPQKGVAALYPCYLVLYSQIFFSQLINVSYKCQTNPTGHVWFCGMSSPWAWTPINLPGIPKFSCRVLPNGRNNYPCLIRWLWSCSLHGVINSKVSSK